MPASRCSSSAASARPPVACVTAYPLSGHRSQPRGTAVRTTTVSHDYGVLSASADTSPNRLFPLRRAIDDATSVLSTAGIESARADVLELAAFILDMPRTRLPAVTG